MNAKILDKKPIVFIGRIDNFDPKKISEKVIKHFNASRLLFKTIVKKLSLNLNEEIIKNNLGKPLLKSGSYFISISHSEKMVAIAISKSPIGIDIQYKKDVDYKVLNIIGNDNDNNYFSNAKNKKEAFYNIWTLKEANYKKDNSKLNKEIEIDYSKKLPVLNIKKDYKFAFSSDKKPLIKFVKIKK